MITFIGTFGSHDTLSNYYQQIKARTEAEAAYFMEQQHGVKYHAIFTVDEFIRERNAGRYLNTKPLRWIGEGIA